MREILVFSENDELAFELLSWGGKVKDSLNAKLAAAILGKGGQEKVADYFAYGADKVYLAKDASLTDFYADVYTEALCQIVNSYGSEVILIGSTRRGKELAPRVAQKLGAGYISTAIGIQVKDVDLLADR